MAEAAEAEPPPPPIPAVGCVFLSDGRKRIVPVGLAFHSALFFPIIFNNNHNNNNTFDIGR